MQLCNGNAMIIARLQNICNKKSIKSLKT